MTNIGLKLWSTNTDTYLFDAIRLYENGLYNYIELYVVPGSLNELKKWELLTTNHNIPFKIHCPHFAHKFNLSQDKYLENNLKIFLQVNVYAKALNAKYIILHSGMEGDIKETARQINIISNKYPNEYMIENKPYVAPIDEPIHCVGNSIEEIDYILKNTKCNFCLDISHAICSANSHNFAPYEYIAKFQKLNPLCYHLSDGNIKSQLDQHLHLGDGNYDFQKIFKLINLDNDLAIETIKNYKDNLNDFISDVKYIQKGIAPNGRIFQI